MPIARVKPHAAARLACPVAGSRDHRATHRRGGTRRSPSRRTTRRTSADRRADASGAPSRRAAGRRPRAAARRRAKIIATARRRPVPRAAPARAGWSASAGPSRSTWPAAICAIGLLARHDDGRPLQRVLRRRIAGQHDAPPARAWRRAVEGQGHVARVSRGIHELDDDLAGRRSSDALANTPPMLFEPGDRHRQHVVPACCPNSCCT